MRDSFDFKVVRTSSSRKLSERERKEELEAIMEMFDVRNLIERGCNNIFQAPRINNIL